MNMGSFAEKTARERAYALVDPGTFRELLGPFDRIESPHLAIQGVVPQSDDGVVIARGPIRSKEVLILSLEGTFQGGSVGEVNGAKIAGGLEKVTSEARAGRLVYPVLLFDTGGIRLQEANLGLLAISEIHSAIIGLREFVPVIGVVAGRVGCFGGMSIAAALCSFLIGTEVGRLGLNGPEVIEQEAGSAEFDSQDRVLIWQTFGCRRRFALGQIDQLVEDNVLSVAAAIAEQIENPLTLQSHRKTASVRQQSKRLEEYSVRYFETVASDVTPSSRGLLWFQALTETSAPVEKPESVLFADLSWGEEHLRVIAVVPNPNGRFPRARHGEVGVEEGWKIAQAVRDAIDGDRDKTPRAILAIVDVPGQAFGLQEEALGIHLSLAAAVDAYVGARRCGHPIVTLIVGKAISGAFLSHGMQANEILALDDPSTEIHVMSAASVARITRRSADEVAQLESVVPCTARSVDAFAGLGAVDRMLKVSNPAEPNTESITMVRAEILNAIKRIRVLAREPKDRLASPMAAVSRKLSREVRNQIDVQWTAHST